MKKTPKPPILQPPIPFQPMIPYRVYEDLRHDLLDLRAQIKNLEYEKMDAISREAQERKLRHNKK